MIHEIFFFSFSLADAAASPAAGIFNNQLLYLEPADDDAGALRQRDSPRAGGIF